MQKRIVATCRIVWYDDRRLDCRNMRRGREGIYDADCPPLARVEDATTREGLQLTIYIIIGKDLFLLDFVCIV